MSAEHHLDFLAKEESACLRVNNPHIGHCTICAVSSRGFALALCIFFCIEIVILFVFYSHALQSLSQPVKTTRRDFGI